MAKLVWDALGTHLFETGVDHAVLYPVGSNGTYPAGIAWNGITGVTQSPSGADETKLWADNIKYVSLRAAEEFGGTIEAYTYPDEFAECDGSANVVSGLRAGQQPRKAFGLAYRTKIGNDTDLDNHGYMLHLVYGATCSPSQRSYSTTNDSPEAITFSWEFSTNPVNFAGFKPTSYMEIDSTKFTGDDAALLTALEAKLFGSDGTVSYTEFEGESFAVGTTYYERSGTSPNYVYTPTEDTSKQAGKTYYTKTTSGASDPYLPLPDEVASTLGYTAD